MRVKFKFFFLRRPSATGWGVHPEFPTGVEVSPIVVRDGSEIERAVATLAHFGNAGLIVTASGLRASDNNVIVTLAARYRLPAVYPFSYFATDGGQVRVAHKSQDRKGARPRHPGDRARPRRRRSSSKSDFCRLLLHLLTTAFGTTRTPRNVRFPVAALVLNLGF
jgi:hypothetical protein